jgi:hypothetical protein
LPEQQQVPALILHPAADNTTITPTTPTPPAIATTDIRPSDTDYIAASTSTTTPAADLSTSITPVSNHQSGTVL